MLIAEEVLTCCSSAGCFPPRNLRRSWPGKEVKWTLLGYDGDVGSRETHKLPGYSKGLCHDWDIPTQPPRSRICPGAGHAHPAE